MPLYRPVSRPLQRTSTGVGKLVFRIIRQTDVVFDISLHYERQALALKNERLLLTKSVRGGRLAKFTPYLLGILSFFESFNAVRQDGSPVYYGDWLPSWALAYM